MSSHTIDPQLDTIREKRKTNLWKKYFGWICFITVEPTMWLYYVAIKITSIVHQEFYIQRSCRVDHGLSEEICNNLTANATLEAQVQVTVSNFLQWNSIVGQLFPIILAVFFGGWSDRRGRKVPLIIALVGKVIYAVMIVVNSFMDTWGLNMILYTATLPMAMLGNDVVIFASCYSYIADVSSNEKRTLRITILTFVFFSTIPTGVALGWYLFYNVVDSSYTVMFIIHGVLVVLAVLYTAVRLEMRTSPQQRPLEKGTNPILDFFDKKHLTQTITTLRKQRPGNRRLYLWILLLVMALYAFEENEVPMNYLYTQLKFSWNVGSFSQFETFQTCVLVVAMLFGVPIMSKFLGMRDTLIALVGTLFTAVGHILLALAEIPELFYAGAAVAVFGSVAEPVLRSMSSKVVPATERGKVLVLLSVCDKAVPLISGPLYSQLYNATITVAPGSIYWLTVVAQIAILLLIMVIHVTQGTRQIDCEDRENTTDLDASEPLKKRLPSGMEVDTAVRT